MSKLARYALLDREDKIKGSILDTLISVSRSSEILIKVTCLQEVNNLREKFNLIRAWKDLDRSPAEIWPLYLGIEQISAGEYLTSHLGLYTSLSVILIEPGIDIYTYNQIMLPILSDIEKAEQQIIKEIHNGYQVRGI